MTYGYTVRWRARHGGTVEVSVCGCASADEAFIASFEAAKRMGYRRPSWWQLVRWLHEIDYEAKAASLTVVQATQSRAGC
jgi:hypothetical protein